MFDFEVKKMEERHLEQIERLEKLCFSVPWSKALLKEEISKQNSNFLVAESNGNVVLGYVGFNFVVDEGYITNLAVFPEYRCNGIAEKLLKKVIEFARSLNLKFVSLEVRKSNVTAISLYERLNFLNVGIRKNFYSLPSEDAVIMTLYL